MRTTATAADPSQRDERARILIEYDRFYNVYTAYTVYTVVCTVVYTGCTVCTVHTVYIVYTLYTVYSVYSVYRKVKELEYEVLNGECILTITAKGEVDRDPIC